MTSNSVAGVALAEEGNAVERPTGDRLVIPVRYRLREYLRCLEDFYPIATGRRRRDGVQRPTTWITRALLYPIGTVAFWVKRRKVGDCRFTIDAHGVERTSAQGTLCVPWSDVATVWVLSGAYLVEKSGGAMPLPFRCMDTRERTMFERHAGRRVQRTVSSTQVVVPAQAETR